MPPQGGPVGQHGLVHTDRLRIPVPVRWADLDAYGHVNNVAVFTLLEEARIAAFWRQDPAEAGTGVGGGQAPPTAVLDAGPGSDTVTVVARQEIEYLAPIPHLREPVVVELWLGRLGDASIDVCYEVTAGAGAARQVFVQAATTVVLLDAATNRPRRLTDEERAVWAPLVGPPVAWRRRP